MLIKNQNELLSNTDTITPVLSNVQFKQKVQGQYEITKVMKNEKTFLKSKVESQFKTNRSLHKSMK